jgi:hypothetical protein
MKIKRRLNFIGKKHGTIVLYCLAGIMFLFSCDESSLNNERQHKKALKRGISANEGFRRCLNYTRSWLHYADTSSGLIPQNLYQEKAIWNAHNAAADNYPFMVLTAYLLDKQLYGNRMLDMLRAEKKLTSRLGVLPAPYSLTEDKFVNEQVDTSLVIFGTSEYIKDGLLPLTEYMGKTPWSERMIEMLDELGKYFTIAGNDRNKAGITPVETEINGELLQTLSRVYWMTGEKKYLNQAKKIADYYLLNKNRLIDAERLRLRDHGCEIIGGLSELYATMHYTDIEKKKIYRKPFYEILDRILAVGRNEHGMFYNEVNMASGSILDSNIVDTWGYLYNAYYTVYRLDKKKEYREAVIQPLKILNEHYRDFDWESGSADGFADAIEGGINLYNREQVPELRRWINNEIQVMWSLQDSSYRSNASRWENSGIIEGWHGDGNFARTTLMYCLWKTQDIMIEPWRSDVIFGATTNDNDMLYLTLKAKEGNWNGNLTFGTKRHKKILNLPLDYSRINQFPEWFVLGGSTVYQLHDLNKKEIRQYRGNQLIKGIPLELKEDSVYRIQVRELK